MTVLRQRMIEDMQVRNFSPHTKDSYVQQVSLFARYFDKSPELLGPEEIRAYEVYLTNERKLAPSSILIAVAALRFLYKVTLKTGWTIDEVIPAPKKPQKLPIILSPEEVLHFLECVLLAKHRVILTSCYAAGLRISEAIRLKPTDIDSQRMVIRIEQGKGQKDRLWAAAHNRSYVPENIMCSGSGQNLRRQAPRSDCPAHNYLPLNEAISLSAGRKRPRLRVGGRPASSISRFCEGSARRYASVL
jgi:site-specific recombinase XerD